MSIGDLCLIRRIRHMIDTRTTTDRSEATPIASARPGEFRFKPLLLLFVLGFIPRIYWMITRTPVISGEGSEYVRMAENLALGKGLVGNFEGPETMYAPFFPLLTAALHVLIKNA